VNVSQLLFHHRDPLTACSFHRPWWNRCRFSVPTLHLTHIRFSDCGKPDRGRKTRAPESGVSGARVSGAWELLMRFVQRGEPLSEMAELITHDKRISIPASEWRRTHLLPPLCGSHHTLRRKYICAKIRKPMACV
jgi:hypothetical protein